MRCLLCPDLLFDHVEELTAAYLKEKQVTLLLCDLDNTLALHETVRPTDAVRAWVKELTEAGIQVMIVSNNRSPARVEAYCGDLGIPYVGHAGKPKRGRLLEAMRQLGVTRAETVYIGDSDVDVETARNAGVACCAVSWGFRSVQCLRDAGAARIAANPQELLAMLEAL